MKLFIDIFISYDAQRTIQETLQKSVFYVVNLCLGGGTGTERSSPISYDVAACRDLGLQSLMERQGQIFLDVERLGRVWRSFAIRNGFEHA